MRLKLSDLPQVQDAFGQRFAIGSEEIGLPCVKEAFKDAFRSLPLGGERPGKVEPHPR